MKNWTEIGDLSFTNGGQTAVVLLSCVLTNTSVAGKISVRGKWPSAAVDVRKRWNSVTLESFEFTVGAKKKSPEGYQSLKQYGIVQFGNIQKWVAHILPATTVAHYFDWAV